MAVYIPTRADWEGAKTVPVLDALYFAVVTVTTVRSYLAHPNHSRRTKSLTRSIGCLVKVGYGDLTPKTWELKLFMSFFVWISIGLIGIILGEAAGYGVLKNMSCGISLTGCPDQMGPVTTRSHGSPTRHGSIEWDRRPVCCIQTVGEAASNPRNSRADRLVDLYCERNPHFLLHGDSRQFNRGLLCHINERFNSGVRGRCF